VDTDAPGDEFAGVFACYRRLALRPMSVFLPVATAVLLFKKNWPSAIVCGIVWFMVGAIGQWVDSQSGKSDWEARLNMGRLGKYVFLVGAGAGFVLSLINGLHWAIAIGCGLGTGIFFVLMPPIVGSLCGIRRDVSCSATASAGSGTPPSELGIPDSEQGSDDTGASCAAESDRDSGEQQSGDGRPDALQERADELTKAISASMPRWFDKLGSDFPEIEDAQKTTWCYFTGVAAAFFSLLVLQHQQCAAGDAERAWHRVWSTLDRLAPESPAKQGSTAAFLDSIQGSNAVLEAFQDCELYFSEECPRLEEQGVEHDHIAPTVLGSWVAESVCDAEGSTVASQQLSNTVGALICQHFAGWWDGGK